MDDKILDTLRSLPREGASAAFTPRVLERVAAARRRRRHRSLAAAAVAVLLAGAVGALRWGELRERHERLDRLEALRAEQRQLESELARLRRLAEAREPVIYLGGSDQVDLVVSWPPDAISAAARPAAYAAADRRSRDVLERP